MLSLSFVDGTLVAAAGVSIGAAVSRPVRLVQALLDAGYGVRRDELPAAGDLSSLIKYLKAQHQQLVSLAR